MENKKNLDDFWDIDDIVPKKKLSGAPRDTSAYEISQRTEKGTDQPLVLSGKTKKEKSLFFATELLSEYSPQNPLIKSVKLFAWPSAYAYYEKFKADARYFFAHQGEECEHVPFFSYIPQYHQLTKSQLAFYLWFRENARRGEFLYCDFSYIMLYIYELINIPEMEGTQKALDTLMGLWLAYRERFPRLDKYLVEWICDFSLIYRISPDMKKLESIYGEIVDSASFKEFYAPSTQSKEEAAALLAIGALSGYDFKKSKYAKEDNYEIFEKNIVGAIGYAISKLDLFKTSELKSAKIRRDAFGGALASSDRKRVIEVEYYSLSQSYELRSIMTNAVKYAENAVRASLGIKSRLGNLTLPEKVREAIDLYMSENLSRRKKKEEIPEYEKRYELPKTVISSENAKDIERASWETTKLLVEAFEEDVPKRAEEKTEEKLSPEIAGDDPFCDLISVLGEDEISFISLALKEDYTAQKELCAKLGKLPEIITEMINLAATDICGDIILEEKDGGFAVIDDYKEDVAAWIK